MEKKFEHLIKFLPEKIQKELIRIYNKKKEEIPGNNFTVFEIYDDITKIINDLTISECCKILSIISSEDKDETNFVRDIIEGEIIKKILSHKRWSKWILKYILENFEKFYNNYDEEFRIEIFESIIKFLEAQKNILIGGTCSWNLFTQLKKNLIKLTEKNNK